MILHKYDLRHTKPRLLILQTLENNHTPQSAQDIYAKLKKYLNLASVYRNLSVFESLGIVHREHSLNEDYFYLSETQHHHIVCIKCGYKECLPCDHDFRLKNFFNIKHYLILKGVCTKCMHHK